MRLRGRGLRDGSPSQVAGQHLRLGGQLIYENVEILNIDGFLIPDCSPRSLGNLPLLRTFRGIDKAS